MNELKRNLLMAEQSKTYCPLPFIHSHAGLNGKYKPCCNSDSLFNHWDYHIEKLGYNDWFKHPEMDKLRNDLLKGVKNKMCDVCCLFFFRFRNLHRPLPIPKNLNWLSSTALNSFDFVPNCFYGFGPSLLYTQGYFCVF